MLSRPIRLATASRPVRGLLLPPGAVLVLIALGTHPGSPPVEGAPAPAVVSASAVSSAPATPATTNCWITGDLAGEGNPAELAAALCGKK